MSDLHVKYLLMGGGVAGSEAARAIREIDGPETCCWSVRRWTRPYHRPGHEQTIISRQARRRHRRLFAMPAEWFVDHHVQLRTGRHSCAFWMQHAIP